MRSPSARVLRNRCDVYANTAGQDAVRAPAFNYPDIPTIPGAACSVQYVATDVDENMFAKLTTVNHYDVMFASNPRLKPRDKVVWTDPSPNRVLYVQSCPPSEAGRDGAFVVRCVEQT